MGRLIVEELIGARNIIHHYIIKLLLPSNISPQKDKRELLNKIINFIRPGDTVISFNYDILIEQALWKHGMWNPLDGYVIDDLFCLKLKDDTIKLPQTKVPVIKLHGSVNWRVTEWYENSEDWERNKIRILLKDIYDHQPLFEGFDEIDENIDKKYTYPHNPFVILPTFMKSFKYKWQFQLFELATKAISQANEIFIWGYSLPQADTLANLLFHYVKKNAKIIIIDPAEQNDNSVDARLRKYHQINDDNIIYEQASIEDWVKNGFSYHSYHQKRRLKTRFSKIVEEVNQLGWDYSESKE